MNSKEQPDASRPVADRTDDPGVRDLLDRQRERRQKAVAYGQNSVRLEGFTLDNDIQALNQQYIDGAITSDELTAAIKRAVG